MVAPRVYNIGQNVITVLAGDEWIPVLAGSQADKVITAANLASYVLGGGAGASVCLFSQTQAVTVANTLVETPLTGTGVGTLTLPANLFSAGKTLKMLAFGFHSTVSNAHITINVNIDGSPILTTGSVASSNGTNDVIEIRGAITCYTAGASGTVFAQGFYDEDNAAAAPFGMVNTTATAFDTTVAHDLSLTAQWGTASASDTITVTNLLLEITGP